MFSEKHRLLCGNAAQFQGDERDVVFLSMVDGPPEDGKLPYRDAGPKDLYKKRYNVAVSRARNQLWLVHSLDPDAHLKAGDSPPSHRARSRPAGSNASDRGTGQANGICV